MSTLHYWNYPTEIFCGAGALEHLGKCRGIAVLGVKTLADLYGHGDMRRTHRSLDDLLGQARQPAWLERSARNVWERIKRLQKRGGAFGPVLVHGGVLNTDGFKRYGWENAPRTAIGMVEQGHYVAIMVEGRYNGSRGWSVPVLAAHMAEIGATEALNLDGGGTTALVFIGEQIMG